MPEEKSQEIDYRKSFYSHRDAMEEVLSKLKKVHVLLEHIDDQYGWSEKPEIHAAFNWMIRSPEEAKSKGEDLLGRHSCDWVLDYESIMTFLNIVGDYVYDSERSIREAMEKVQ